jgi:hypothetical protein
MKEMKNPNKITKADIGKTFLFHGFDGLIYKAAELTAFNRGIATIKYVVWSVTPPVIATGYISELNRLERH